MKREKVETFEYVSEANRIMRDGGLLLVSEGKDGKPNAMTIGWGLLGTIWRRPFFGVAVRLSRHTHRLLEESGRFTVCLPAKGMDKVLDVCGTRSGRDTDKFEELNLTAARGYDVDAPYIAECPVHWECIVAYKDELKPGRLPKEIEEEVYPNRNMHVIYYGEVKGAYAVEDAAERLPP